MRQPPFQGLYSSLPLERKQERALVGAGHFVSQNLEDFKLMADGRSSSLAFWLHGIQIKLSDSLGLRGSCRGSIHRETPKNVYEAIEAVSLSCSRLCKSVGDISHRRNLYRKGNRQLLAIAENFFDNALPRSDVLSHLVSRPCEWRLKQKTWRQQSLKVSNHLKWTSLSSVFRVALCAAHIQKFITRNESNVAENVPCGGSRHGLCFTSTPSPHMQVIISARTFRNLLRFVLLSWISSFFFVQFRNNRVICIIYYLNNVMDSRSK